MRNILFLIIGLFTYYGSISQETENKYQIRDFFETYFEARELNLILKYNAPETDAVLYTVNGLKRLSGLDIKLMFFHESYKSHNKVSIQTRFTIDAFRSINEKYDFINSWAGPSYPARIFWDDKGQVFVLTVTTLIFSKTVSLSRMDDLFLGFIAALKDLNQSQKIKL